MCEHSDPPLAGSRPYVNPIKERTRPLICSVSLPMVQLLISSLFLVLPDRFRFESPPIHQIHHSALQHVHTSVSLYEFQMMFINII
jgi:hypothetical protein